MDIRKFTTNSQQAMQEAQALAFEYNHPQIDTLHLLTALLQQKESIVLTVLKKIEAPVEQILLDAEKALKRLPKGQMKEPQAGQVFITASMNFALVNSEKESKSMGDEFISTEHLFLSLLKVESAASEIFKLYKN